MHSRILGEERHSLVDRNLVALRIVLKCGKLVNPARQEDALRCHVLERESSREELSLPLDQGYLRVVPFKRCVDVPE